MFDDFDEYMVFSEVGVTKIEGRIFPLKFLYSELKRMNRIIDELSPTELGVLVPLVITSAEFSTAMGLKPSRQGSLLENGGVEESARKELVHKLKVAEEKSISSIKIGNNIAKKLVQQNMSVEDLSEELKGTPDEKISRHATHFSRLKNLNIDFVSSSQKIGGNLKIPTHLNSNHKMKFTQCVVSEYTVSGEFVITTIDSIQANDSSLVRNGTIKAFCDITSINYTLLQLAYLFRTRFEFEAVLTEKINDKRKTILVTKVEPVRIFESVDQGINDLKENLSFDF